MEPAGKSAAPELFSIGVLGAGIGGLTTALALREAGFGDIHVYEAGAAGAGSDTGLSLAPNATRVLHALGLKDELRSHSSHPQAHLQRTWRRGFLLAQRPLGQFSEARYGAPHIIIGHATLLGMLLKSCAEHGVAISDNRGCTGVSQANGRVLAAFDDQNATHDVLIGCEGSVSVVRDYLRYPLAGTHNGTTAWCGSAPIGGLPLSLTADAITSWLGPGQHLIHWPSPDGERVEFLAFASASKSDLTSCFATWHPDLCCLISSSDSLTAEPCIEHQPIAQWYDGRVALLGDACHVLPPILQLGAALAMEDAWVLSRMLERWEDDPPAGFEEYQQYRKVRVTRARRASRDCAAQWCCETPRQILQRNVKLALMSRFLPEIAMQQLDWLYGYDCIQGFE